MLEKYIPSDMVKDLVPQEVWEQYATVEQYMNMETLAIGLTGVIILQHVVAKWRIRRLRHPLTGVEQQAKAYAKKAKIETDTARVNAEQQVEQLLRDSKQTKTELEQKISRLQEDYTRILQDVTGLNASRKEKQKAYEAVLKELEAVSEEKEFMDIGVYQPHFNFGDCDRFKEEIRKLRQKQKDLIKAKRAVQCEMEWEIEGSKREGQKMVNRAINLSLRAFNNECETCIANVTWRNIGTMENRIYRAFDQVNKLNETLRIFIAERFLNMKLKELRMTHEYKEKLKEEQEERRYTAQQEREEKKLMDDLARAQREEDKFQKELNRVRREAERASDARADEYRERIEELQRELEEAHEEKERAKTMAQLTSRGYVYILSNIGSFGKDIYKIGMTRRVDPNLRIKELSGASVPFLFDVHALIYCNDAPGLETYMHTNLDQYRVNLVNQRKEFFKCPLSIVEQVLRKRIPDADIITGVEAQEYYETLAIIEQNKEKEAA